MVEFFAGLFSSVFGGNSWLATIVVSMFPIVELKGAIPIGVSSEFWGDNALTSMQAFWCSLLGSCLVVPILALLFTPILKWMKGTKIFKKVSGVIEEKVFKSSLKIGEKTKNHTTSKKSILLKMIGIFLFVADPFPFTGVWTGTCVGVALGLTFTQTVIAVVSGNVVAGLLVMFVCSAFPQFSTILFLIVMAIIVVMCCLFIIKLIIKKKNTSNNLSAIDTNINTEVPTSSASKSLVVDETKSK